MERHNWTKKETQIVLYAYLIGMPSREAKILAEKLGLNPNAFCLRMANFKYLDTDGKQGLNSVLKCRSKLLIWEEYCKFGINYIQESIQDLWNKYCNANRIISL